MLTPYLSALKEQLEEAGHRDEMQEALLWELNVIDADDVFARRVDVLSDRIAEMPIKTSGGQVPPKNRCKCCNKPLP